MEKCQKTKIGEFLFEREGKYKPDGKSIAGLRRIEKIDFSGNFHIAQKPSKTNMILICPDDLVISGINVSKGAMGIYHGNEDVTATIHYSSYTFDTAKIDVEYFKRFLKSAEFIRLLREQVKGGIKTEIKPKHILPLEINLPNLAEQRNILSHFKSVETEDGELKQELTHQQTLLKKLRQQILQEAIEGRLTADWREQNPDVEPASELLVRIQVEKAQLIKDKKLKKQKPLPAISEAEKPFELPEGWVWCRLGELIYTLQYGTSKKCSYDTSRNTPVLRIPNVSSGKVDSQNLKYTDLTDKEKVQYSLQSGDLLVIRSNGSRKIVGKSVFVPKQFENFGYAGYLIRLRFGLDKLNIFYIQKYLRSWTLRDQIETPLRTTVGINNINSTELSSLLIPLPPLAELKAIVTKVEKLLALCDQLQTQITQNQSHADGLMQAVLKEAFIHSNESPEKVLVNA